jgi:hypothetical protein
LVEKNSKKKGDKNLPLSRTIKLEDEWKNFIQSQTEVPGLRKAFIEGAFSVFKMISAEDELLKISEVMRELGEQFRSEKSGL